MSALPPVRISVIVPVYNGWDHVAHLLEHLGVVSEDAEVLIVDDASPEEGIDALAARFPWVRTIRRQVNGGFAAAVNTGLEAAAGRSCAILNSDLLIDAESLDRLVATSEAAGAVTGPLTLRPNGELIRTAYPFPNPATQPLELHPLFRIVRKALGKIPSRQRGDWLVGSALVVPKAVVETVGPLNESYGMYSEEVDWQRRISRTGVPVRLVEEATAIHDETHGASRYGNSATRRHLAIWRSRRAYFRTLAGTRQEGVFRATTVAVCATAVPILAPMLLFAPTRSVASHELRRLKAVAGVMGEAIS